MSTHPELERFFFLDDDDRELIASRRTDAHRLGMAVQICTVRHIGWFLGDEPLAVPWEVAEYLVEQLGSEDASCVKRSPSVTPTVQTRAPPGGRGRDRPCNGRQSRTDAPPGTCSLEL